MLLILLFADDVALCSDTAIGLQRQIHILHNYCQDSGISVNTDKTKIMVFKKGGQLSNHEHWTYNVSEINIVNNFTYVGVTFTSKLSYNTMASQQAVKAKRAFVSIMNSLYKFGQLPQNIYFKLFDMKVMPVLLYGSELWGYAEIETVEIVHRYACKRFLCVGQKSCNAAVLAECGRIPVFVDSQVRCVKFWLRLLELPEHRYVKKCYLMLKHVDNNNKLNWVSQIRKLLTVNGFGYVWEMQSVVNKNLFISQFKQRLIDQYLQEWHNVINEMSRLCLYRTIKSSYAVDMYISVLNIRKFRHSYCSLKIGSLDLEIQRGRYNNVPRDQRLCKLCHNEVEDEYHFLLKCPLYDELRAKYIPSKYCVNPNLHKFVLLMSCRNSNIILSTATFIYMAHLKRKVTLQNLQDDQV